MEDNRLSKVGVLIEQQRFLDAEKILKELLSEAPNDTMLLYLLADTNLGQGKLEEAYRIIDAAIRIDPVDASLFYLKSRIAVEDGNLYEAEKNIQEAVKLIPNNADLLAFLSHVTLLQGFFTETLVNTEHALAIDPTNLLALNTRGAALRCVGRIEESVAVIEYALRENPGNPYLQANYGWTLMMQGKQKQALEHFKDALRSDPNLDIAQTGLLEAIKVSNPVYRIFATCLFFMATLFTRFYWVTIIAMYAVAGWLVFSGKINVTLDVGAIHLLVLFPLSLAFVLAWSIGPIGNFFLQFNKYGEFLLNRKEKTSSRLVGASLGIFLLGLILYLILPDIRFVALAVFGFSMMLPSTVVFLPSDEKSTLIIYAIILVITGLMAVVGVFMTGDLFNVMAIIFAIGFIGFQMTAISLVRQEGEY